MRSIWLVVGCLSGLGFFACNRPVQVATAMGTLTGRVTIGPLCPVLPCTLSDTRVDTIYRTYTLSLRRTDTYQVEGIINNLDHTGAYRLTLRAGDYQVICEKCLRKEVAATFTVPANQITQKNIQVDTGIR
jgi:hypothetical protein